MFTVIIPVKDEPYLTSFLGKIHEVATLIPDDHEVLIVQGDREKKFHPYKTFPNQRTIFTYGDSLERSILNGLSHAKGDNIFVMDADGSHPPKKLFEFYKALEDYDMVIGSRFVDGSDFNSSLFRGLVTEGFRYLAWFAGSNLKDPMSGFFGIRRELLKGIKFKPFTWKTCLELEMKCKPKVLEIPISFVERSNGVSKTTIKIGLKILFELAFMGLTGRI